MSNGLSNIERIFKNDICHDNFRENNVKSGMEFITNLSTFEPPLEANNEELSNETKCNIFRFKFREDFMNNLSYFSKIHQYDSRSDFKKYWQEWLKENEELVDSEVRYLENTGYRGDVIDKMFKSARYYFRKKGTEKKEPKERRNYISISKRVLEIMDNHIHSNIKDVEFKPSTGFDQFCANNVDILRNEIQDLRKSGLCESKEIQDKFKKTYKNRYFIISRNK